MFLNIIIFMRKEGYKLIKVKVIDVPKTIPRVFLGLRVCD